ncbi:uncharacterized, partial [Tachysurus ichikawai]
YCSVPSAYCDAVGLTARALIKMHACVLNGPREDDRFPLQEEAGPQECHYVVFDRPACFVFSHERHFPSRKLAVESEKDPERLVGRREEEEGGRTKREGIKIEEIAEEQRRSGAGSDLSFSRIADGTLKTKRRRWLSRRANRNPPFTPPPAFLIARTEWIGLQSASILESLHTPVSELMDDERACVLI